MRVASVVFVDGHDEYDGRQVVETVGPLTRVHVAGLDDRERALADAEPVLQHANGGPPEPQHVLRVRHVVGPRQPVDVLEIIPGRVGQPVFGPAAVTPPDARVGPQRFDGPGQPSREYRAIDVHRARALGARPRVGVRHAQRFHRPHHAPHGRRRDLLHDFRVPPPLVLRETLAVDDLQLFYERRLARSRGADQHHLVVRPFHGRPVRRIAAHVELRRKPSVTVSSGDLGRSVFNVQV